MLPITFQLLFPCFFLNDAFVTGFLSPPGYTHDLFDLKFIFYPPIFFLTNFHIICSSLYIECLRQSFVFFGTTPDAHVSIGTDTPEAAWENPSPTIPFLLGIVPTKHVVSVLVV